MNILKEKTIIFLCGLLTFTSITAVTAAQSSSVIQNSMNAQTVHAYYPDKKLAAKVKISFEGSILSMNKAEGYYVMLITENQKMQLEQFGMKIVPVTTSGPVDKSTFRASSVQNIESVSSSGGVAGYQCYRSVNEVYSAAQTLAANNPSLVQWIDIGDSWEKESGTTAGFDLMVLKITNSSVAAPKPILFLTSSLHAREMVPAELALQFAEYLIANYNRNADATWLVDNREIHLMFQANPDGRSYIEQSGLDTYKTTQRKNRNISNVCSELDLQAIAAQYQIPMEFVRQNYQAGVDLNRNFSWNWDLHTGTDPSSCGLTYPGLFAASEPETQAIQNYMRSIFFDQRGSSDSDPAPLTTSGLYIDLHSFGELILWPWGHTETPAPNGTQLQTLGRKFSTFNGYEPLQSIGLYPTSGTSIDFAYGELGIAAYTMEFGTSFYQPCSDFTDTILPQNLKKLLYAAKIANLPYLTPSGPIVTTDTANELFCVEGNTCTLWVTSEDVSSSDSGTPQSISKIHYYIDELPSLSSVGITMNAADGAFDEASEIATASIDTRNLAPGKHTIYIRSQDAEGNWGAVSAIYINCIKLGDVNADGQITIVDALLIAQISADQTPQNFHSEAADVNCDGTISIVDALLVSQLTVGKISKFPCSAN